MYAFERPQQHLHQFGSRVVRHGSSVLILVNGSIQSRAIPPDLYRYTRSGVDLALQVAQNVPRVKSSK